MLFLSLSINIIKTSDLEIQDMEVSDCEVIEQMFKTYTDVLYYKAINTEIDEVKNKLNKLNLMGCDEGETFETVYLDSYENLERVLTILNETIMFLEDFNSSKQNELDLKDDFLFKYKEKKKEVSQLIQSFQ